MKNLQKHNHPSSISVEHTRNPFLAIHNEIDKAMNGLYDLFEPKNFNLEQFINSKLLPSMDLVEDKDHYKVELELPGMDEKDIKISVENNVLTVEGEKSVSKKNDNKNYISREISYGRYERSLSLPLSADMDKISATFKKGMLWVTIPKKEGSKGTAREIKVEKA